jgi:hypothetical protein
MSKPAKPGAAAGAGDSQPGMRLNRRMKDIIATGLLPSMSPSALTVLTFAAAYGDFTNCKVFLGAKTVANAAFRGKVNRNAARRGIAELLGVGFLVRVQDRTARKATVYRLAVVPELVAAARARIEEASENRKRSRQGGSGCAPRGAQDDPPGGLRVCPQGGSGCAPNHSSIVPSSLKERTGKRPPAGAGGVLGDGEQADRLAALRSRQRRPGRSAPRSESDGADEAGLRLRAAAVKGRKRA